MDDYPCVDEATCINNEGDFECACPEGYHGNGKYHCGSKYTKMLFYKCQNKTTERKQNHVEELRN